MTNVLINPDRFFAELSAKDTKLITPSAIVLVTAIIAAISAVVMMGVVTSSLPEAVTAIGAILALVMQFIMWLVYTGIFYVISIFFSGEGSFKRCLEFIGYGFIPSIIAAIIGLVVMMTVLPTIEFSVENPELFSQTLMSNSLMQAYAILGIFFTLWSANIWIFAIKHARNLSTRNALFTVGVPVGLYMIYGISMMYIMGM